MDNWLYSVGEEQVGPRSAREIQDLVVAGTITGATMMWTDGLEDWQPYETVAQRITAPLSNLAPSEMTTCPNCNEPLEYVLVQGGTGVDPVAAHGPKERRGDRCEWIARLGNGDSWSSHRQLFHSLSVQVPATTPGSASAVRGRQDWRGSGRC